MTRRQAVVIASGHARRGREAFEAIPRMLLERGVEVVDTHTEPTRKKLCKRVKRAIKDGARLIVVCGGDGTQTHVVPLLAYKKCALGVVPAGTGNSFALGLGIGDSLEAAADAIAYGEEARVDLGVVNRTYFANFLTIGVASQIARDTPRPLKSSLGALAYGIAGVIPLLRHKPFRADFRWRGHRVKVETHQAIVANGRFYGHQPLSRDASLVDGRLTVFVRDAKSNIDLVQTYLALLRGEQQQLDGAHIWSTQHELTIRTKRKAHVALDGSVFCKTPVRVGVAPKALRVMVPSKSALRA